MDNEPLSATLGSFLKRRRKELHLTLRDVERITERGVSNAYLSQLENGDIKSPSLSMLHRLSAAYALDFGDLCERMVGGNFPAAPRCPTCGQEL